MSQRFETLLKDHTTPSDRDATERRAFERTRMLLRYRNHTIGMAVAYSLLPFAFLFHNGRVDWIMMRDKPSIAVAFAFTAVACWLAAYIINRRARRQADETPG